MIMESQEWEPGLRCVCRVKWVRCLYRRGQTEKRDSSIWKNESKISLYVSQENKSYSHPLFIGQKYYPSLLFTFSRLSSDYFLK